MQTSNTFELSGKTYNAKQINAVFIENTRKYNPSVIGAGWVGGGVVTALLLNGIPETFDSRITTIIWGILTIASIVVAFAALFSDEFCLVFEMSSGKVKAFKCEDRDEIENLKSEIVKKIDEFT